jgi:hypothetical protein
MYTYNRLYINHHTNLTHFLFVILLLSLLIAFDTPKKRINTSNDDDDENGKEDINKLNAMNTIDIDQYYQQDDLVGKNKSNKYSVLQNANRDRVRMKPFPHVVIENALPEEIYRELEEAYPTYLDVLKVAKPNRIERIKENTRVDMRASMILGRGQKYECAKVWREFVEYHASRSFFEEVIDLFGEDLFRKYHGALEKKYKKKLRDLATEVRLMSSKKNPAPITLDAQIGVNTPVRKGASRVRGLHVDNAHEIYAGLLYFKDENDPATGGNLEIFECLKGPGKCEEYTEYERKIHREKVGFDVQFKNLGDFRKIDEIPYAKNQFILFINSPSSYHAVTPRTSSVYPRRLVNVAGNEYYERETNDLDGNMK